MKSCSITSTFIVAAALLLSACAAPPKVRVDRDSSTNFASYKTFAWLAPYKAPEATEATPTPGQEAPPATVEINSLVDTRVRNAIVAALQAKGYALTDSNPDFKVSYAFNVYESEKDSGMRIGLGAGGGSGHAGGSLGVSIPVGKTRNTMGTITIDIIDGARNAQVWTGSYAKKVAPEGLDDESATLLVSTILERFPNDPKKK